MLTKEQIFNTMNMAKNMRINAIKMTNKSKASHIGAILSVTDIVATCYNLVLNFNPKDTTDKNRDIFILSKGHSGVSVYCALAEIGAIKKSDLDGYYQLGSKLSGHISHKVNGVEFTTGALGHGLSLAVGNAYYFKVNNLPNQVYVVMGDGECDEGSVWEAIMLAVQLRLDNLHIVVDRNNMQALGWTKDILNLDNLADKFRAFNLNTIECDGHNIEQLYEALKATKQFVPTVVITHTVKGKGVSFMENKLLYHYRNPSDEDMEKAIKELESEYEKNCRK